MKKVTFNDVEKIGFNWELNKGVFTIGGIDVVVTGGELVRGNVKVRFFLKPLDKALKNKDNELYGSSKKDVVYYIEGKDSREFNNYNK